VGVHDVMPQVEWTKLFLEAQGYTVHDTILYQDNKSAMLLEHNGRASSSKRTKHIHLRYFYVMDKVDSGAIHTEHCPTEDMLADYFRKPLQGSLFRRMRDRILNIDPSSQYHSSHRSVLEYTDDQNDQSGDVHGQADPDQADCGNSQPYSSTAVEELPDNTDITELTSNTGRMQAGTDNGNQWVLVTRKTVKGMKVKDG
jgi:hypothetical protein